MTLPTSINNCHFIQLSERETKLIKSSMTFRFDGTCPDNLDSFRSKFTHEIETRLRKGGMCDMSARDVIVSETCNIDNFVVTCENPTQANRVKRQTDGVVLEMGIWLPRYLVIFVEARF